MMNQQFRIQPAHIIFAIFEIIFISFFCISVNQFLSQSNKISNIQVDNIFEQIPNLPDESYGYLESALYSVVAQNTATNFSIADSGALIRENSINREYFDSAKLNYVSFIVDIPSLQQSYRLKYEWTSDSRRETSGNNDIMAMCLPEDQLVYDDFGCQDNYDNRGQEIIVYELSQPRRKIFSSNNYVLAYNHTPYSANFYIKIPLSNCSDDTQINEDASQEFTSFITRLGISPSEISYQVEPYCDIDF